jgi:hypothetical protein
MATDVNDFVMLPIWKRSAGVTCTPAFEYCVVPAEVDVLLGSLQADAQRRRRDVLRFRARGRIDDK